MSTPVDAAALRARLVAPHGPYTTLDVVASTGSTNADLAEAARKGAPDRTVLIAAEQTAGQGRQRRGWVSPAGGLYLSVLFRPAGVPRARVPWLTLLAGVAVARTAAWAGASEPVLKWPNDLLLGPDRRKAAGILAEIDSERELGVVLGIGLNVLPLPEGVPLGAGGLPGTSLSEQGATTLDRTELAAHLLAEIGLLEEAFREAGGDPESIGLGAEYRRFSATLGERVRVELPGQAELLGVAESLEDDGTLVLRTEDGRPRAVSAGDVVHLRAQH
ncbi:MAG TPA: biotin--[acetyl-CoA-carboxylase] ligase [Pseudonocardiaceae bacterium]|jgi:BirA family biotin operon repressor/biotin-[acetyl-CoA-carboxylase] ligase|nr:biotin--[acetyl-CoA-carboxylase] ligase [Pseudonocardiaceae bacterium]